MYILLFISLFYSILLLINKWLFFYVVFWVLIVLGIIKVYLCSIVSSWIEEEIVFLYSTLLLIIDGIILLKYYNWKYIIMRSPIAFVITVLKKKGLVEYDSVHLYSTSVFSQIWIFFSFSLSYFMLPPFRILLERIGAFSIFSVFYIIKWPWCR